MSEQQILDNLSSHLKNAIAKAISLATSMGHEAVSPVHLVMALFQEPGCIAAEMLQRGGLKEAHIVASLETLATVKPADAMPGSAGTALLPELNEPAKRALEKAMLLAYEYQHTYIGTEHLLYGLVSGKDAALSAVLKRAKITKKELKEHLLVLLDNVSKFPASDASASSVQKLQEQMEHSNEHTSHSKRSSKKKKPSALEVFAVNLTSKEAQKRIDPVIGREEEITRLIHVLCRRTKNNPVLIGEAGVGKTAIVEGLAKRIMNGQVPPLLRRKKIYALDLALLVSGTIYRGEFESRIKQIMDEVEQKEEVVLFIDELHNIIGTGSNQGTMDAANMLKPALARGTLRCIGATTVDEYKKYISTDPALDRRFQSIHIEAPSLEEATKILSGIKRFYEAFHGVSITKDAIEAAVHLSHQYVHDNQLPDKAIDLLDEAAAQVRVAMPASKSLNQYHKKLDELHACKEKKEDAISKEAFDEAMALKKKEAKLEKTLKQLEAAQKKEVSSQALRVSKKDVARVLAHRLHIAPEVLLSNRVTQLQALGKALKKVVLGQEEVISQVVKTLERASLHTERNAPHASFLFAGPSGVGKTLLAHELAEAFFHSKEALLKLDMSTFSESHSTAKLLGSPAGYVGHKERNKFLDKIKQRPYSVVLFDNIEKAHPDVLKLLIQVLDEGVLTDSSGETYSFKQAIVVLTTSAGEKLFRTSGFGFDEERAAPEAKSPLQKKRIMAHLEELLFGPLLARLDAVCLFSALTEAVVTNIIKQQVKELSKRLKQTYAITLRAKPSALSHLTKQAHNPKDGARAVNKLMHDVVAGLVIDALQKEKTNGKLQLTVKNKKLRVENA